MKDYPPKRYGPYYLHHDGWYRLMPPMGHSKAIGGEAMNANNDTTPPAPAAGSDDVEAVVLQHLRDIRAREAAFVGPKISEAVALDMAWARYSRTLPNEDLAAVVYYILREHVKPHNVLWAKLREITIRLMANPKGIRPARRVRKPNAERSGGEENHE